MGIERPTSGSRSWMVVKRHTVFQGGPVEVSAEHVRLPDGRELTDYYQVRMPDYAIVFATTERGSILALRQYKHGSRRVSVTFPGGALAPGESPLAAARRELLEETGHASVRWISYGAYVVNANQYCNTAHLFRADGCRRVSDPTAPDLESPELVELAEGDLLRPEMLHEVGLASHAALLAIATHPALKAGVTVR